MYRLLHDLGEYNTAISVAEAYAEEMLRMEKESRGKASVGGYLCLESVRVKGKELRRSNCTLPLSTWYVEIPGRRHSSPVQSGGDFGGKSHEKIK